MSSSEVWERIRERLKGLSVSSGVSGGLSEEEVARVFRERAAGLAREEKPDAGREALFNGMAFDLNGERFAVEVTAVAEVQKIEHTTVVPCTPGHFAGVVNLQGEIVPLVDLLVFWGFSPVTERRWALILEGSGSRLGILVSRVFDVVAISTQEIHPPPLSLPPRLMGSISGEVLVEGKPMLILRSEAILGDEEMTVDEGVEDERVGG